MAVDLSDLMPEQRAIATTLTGPLFVAAGAGSGKTFTLTQRIVWALDPASGPALSSLDQVLAITFTKDAAAEIRERVRRALRAAGMEEAARSVDSAWISTIHGMCSRILRAHALELGIDPEFTVIEDTQELMERAFARTIARAGVDAGQAGPSAAFDGAEGSAATRFAHGGRYAHLLRWYPVYAETGPDGREAGLSIHKVVLRLFTLARSLPGGLDAVSFAQGDASMASFADACRSFARDFRGTKGAASAQAMLDAIDAFEASGRSLDDVVALMESLAMPRASSRSKDAVRLLKAEAADAVIGALAAAGRDAAAELMQLTRAFAAEYASLKREAGGLDNDDLLRCTYEALARNPDIRARYEGRFKLVMIDEFQDTDQQQVDLIRFLCGEDGRALCTVGDAQQSIYRFRGADVEVFRTQERAIECGARAGAQGARVIRLVRNFRSHPDILRYVAQVFDGARGGIMPHFLDLEPHPGREDGLRARGAERCQAVLTVGGTSSERTEAAARAIARRFKALADAGQPVGGMVLLLGAMTNADVYAEAFRAAGLGCIISGGSVFAGTVAARTVRALVWTLANPQDTQEGLFPLAVSPAFALGAEELLALSTEFDAETGATRRRGIDRALDPRTADAPGLEGLPLVARTREILSRALARVGHDPLSEIAHDVVNESGWLVRLASRGAEGRAEAANVLKALDALEEIERGQGSAPRMVARAFDRFLAGKEAPGALNTQQDDAVRIMTVHASKGLEFPVVAVAECYGIRQASGRFQAQRIDGAIQAVALPALSFNKKAQKTLGDACSRWLDLDSADDVCATGSAAEQLLKLRERDRAQSLEERARLLYVAMTRAREVLIMALDASLTSEKRVPTLKFRPETDMTGPVLERILPAGGGLATDRLALEGAEAGSFELIALGDFTYEGVAYEATGAAREDGRAVLSAGPCDAGCSPEAVPDEGAREEPDSFTLAWPQAPDWRVVPAPRPPRISYSYSSLARALHEAEEDQRDAPGDRYDVEVPRAAAGGGAEGDEDPTALGSAFHVAAQWLIEMGAPTVPAGRRAALARQWRLTRRQAERLGSALDRWERSSVRAELRSWPCVRAEVPFFAPGDPAYRSQTGDASAFVEGAIDVLASDPSDRSRALVIDYKTGGTADEGAEDLLRKHELQADTYARVLKEAGYGAVALKFVRVELDDVDHPGEPQVVCYER